MASLSGAEERQMLVSISEVLAYGAYAPVQAPYFIFGKLHSSNALFSSY